MNKYDELSMEKGKIITEIELLQNRLQLINKELLDCIKNGGANKKNKKDSE